MPWILHLPDHQVNLETDVDLDIWAQIEKETGQQWIYCLGQPLQNAGVAGMIAALVTQRLGVECPRLTATTAVEMFKFEPEDPQDFPTSGTEVPTQDAAGTESQSPEVPSGT